MDTNIDTGTNSSAQPVEQKKTNYTSSLVVLVVLMLLGIGLFYVVSSGMFGGNQPPVNTVTLPAASPSVVGSATPNPGLVKVDFTYKVKSVTADAIVLQGKSGDFTLPNDSTKVQAYAGLTKESPKLELAKLKVGDNVNMEFVPGQSATLFVSQI